MAERAGLRPGDTILEVNGTPFRAVTHEEALKVSFFPKLLSFSESETFPRSRNRVSSAMALRLQFQFYRECTTKLFFLFFSSLLENIYDVIRLRIFMRSRDMFLFQLYIPLLIFTFSMWNYF